MILYYGLLLFFILEYARPGNFIPGLNALRLNLLVPVGVMMGTLVRGTPVPNAEILSQTNSRILGGLLLLIVASAAVADLTTMVFELLTTVGGYVVIYWVIARQVYDIPRLKGVFAILVVVHLLLASMTPQMFTDPSTRHYISGGTFLGDGNDFALSVNLVIPFCLFLLFSATSKVQKAGCGIVLLVLLLCIVATQSRGGTLALAFVAFYYWLSSKRKAVTATLAIVGVVVVLVFAPPAYFDRMNTISNYETDGSAQGRLSAWKAGTGMALSNPLLGIGAGNFPSNYTRFAPPNPTGGEVQWKTAHSIYFLILGELGFSGLLLLLGFIVLNIRDNSRLLRELRRRHNGETRETQLIASLNASLFAYAIAGAFLSATYYPHMFVLGGLMVAGRRLAVQGGATPSSAAPLSSPLKFHPAAPRQASLRRYAS